jgi:hypothetical protein
VFFARVNRVKLVHVKHFGTIDGREKIQTCSNTDCAQKLQICGRSKDAAAAYIMDKEVVRRDQFDAAED